MKIESLKIEITTYIGENEIFVNRESVEIMKVTKLSFNIIKKDCEVNLKFIRRRNSQSNIRQTYPSQSPTKNRPAYGFVAILRKERMSTCVQ